jgi:hypothetical protein
MMPKMVSLIEKVIHHECSNRIEHWQQTWDPDHLVESPNPWRWGVMNLSHLSQVRSTFSGKNVKFTSRDWTAEEHKYIRLQEAPNLIS